MSSTRKPDFTDKVFALMSAKRLTYREACRELGRRSASARTANKRRPAWHTRTLRHWIRKDLTK